MIDGDTLTIGTFRIRIFGIDAPEQAQTCPGNAGTWDCGAWATEQMRARYHGKQARCDVLDTDRYGRLVARCFVGGQDIAKALVKDGVAMAFRRYSMDYVDDEKRAFFAGAGIWQGDFQSPEAYRAALRVAPEPAEGSCQIKGNISAKNVRIFHVPGQEHYDRTRISTHKGERWFCSEAEAREAGWRKARR